MRFCVHLMRFRRTADYYAMGFIRLVKHREHDNLKRDYVEK